MIPAGSLRHRVRIENQTASNDATTGERSSVWTTLADRRAQIKPLRGAELTPESGETGEVTAKITLRYEAAFSAITIKTRVTDLDSNDVYDIESLINISEENRVIELMAVKRSR